MRLRESTFGCQKADIQTANAAHVWHCALHFLVRGPFMLEALQALNTSLLFLCQIACPVRL